MTRQPLVARRAETLIGTTVVATAPLAGGDTSTATKLRLSDGTVAVIKAHPHAPPGFFESEAAGLNWLAEAHRDHHGVAVPEVLGFDEECLVVRWVEPARPSEEAARSLGAALARTHQAGHEAFGASEDKPGFIAKLPMPNRSTDSWPEFYATQRVLPYLKLARDRGVASTENTAGIEQLCGRLADLVPDEPPARLHGDLWSGNVLWGAEGSTFLIDPAAYAGHRETDLAMLALFGLPHLEACYAGYQSESPLAEGWEDRQGVHQIYPLLVHACMFGGGYAARAAATAQRYL